MKKLIKIMVPLALVAVLVFAMAGVAFAVGGFTNVTFKGKVLDSKGPIEGVSVEASDGGAAESATTDSNGEYTITMQCWIFDTTATSNITLTAKKSGYKSGSGSVPVGYDAGAQNISVPAITLEKTSTTYTVTGKVLDKDGKPMEGADVTMGTQSITTDANGIFSADFEMDFSSGGEIAFLLKISKEGYVPWKQNQSISASSPTTIDIGTVSLRAYASSEEDTPADTPTDPPTPTQAPDSTKSPKTGGEADAALFLALMGIAAVGIALSAAALRRHAKSNR